MRGLAALYVLLFHVRMEHDWAWRGSGLPAWLDRAMHLIDYGHFAVGVFIVLSGYCLMLPVAHSPDGHLRGGFWRYIRRRARRILPPYYAALTLTLLIIAVVPAMNRRSLTRWGTGSLPAFEPGVLISHALLIHNWFPAWTGRIDPPMWSVAPEWQIYFLMPLVLLPVWRRAGIVGLLVAAILLGLGPYAVFRSLAAAYLPWYVTLFAFGMAAAAVNFSRDGSALLRLPWGWLASAACIVFLAFAAFGTAHGTGRWYIADPLIGVATAATLVVVAKGGAPRMLSVLETRPVVWLGTVSYSLYLIHYPIIVLVHLPMLAAGWTPVPRFIALFVTAVPACLGLSYLFHRAFERPWMTGKPRTEERLAKIAAIEPAI